jgi:hypothetical protein
MKRMPCFAGPWFSKQKKLLIDPLAFLQQIILSRKMPFNFINGHIY